MAAASLNNQQHQLVGPDETTDMFSISNLTAVGDYSRQALSVALQPHGLHLEYVDQRIVANWQTVADIPEGRYVVHRRSDKHYLALINFGPQGRGLIEYDSLRDAPRPINNVPAQGDTVLKLVVLTDQNRTVEDLVAALLQLRRRARESPLPKDGPLAHDDQHRAASVSSPGRKNPSRHKRRRYKKCRSRRKQRYWKKALQTNGREK